MAGDDLLEAKLELIRQTLSAGFKELNDKFDAGTRRTEVLEKEMDELREQLARVRETQAAEKVKVAVLMVAASGAGGVLGTIGSLFAK